LRIVCLIGTIVISGAVNFGERRRRISEQATEPSVIEHAYLRKSLKRRRIAMDPSTDVIEDEWSVGRRRLGIRRVASSGSTLTNLSGIWRS